MRAVCLAILSVLVVAVLATTAVILQNGSTFAWHKAGLAQWSAKLLDHDETHWTDLKAVAMQRARLYENMLNDRFLQRGMVITRDSNGDVASLCDSLLFSSLHYVALQKLGWQEGADEAWRNMLRSKRDSMWLRHPDCTHRLSRDMMVGVLAALTTKPAGYETELRSLVSYVGRHNGYIGDGPFYVSYLSPGLAALLRSLAIDVGMKGEDLPFVLRHGYSTLELDIFGGQRGYHSHLISLTVWVEQEIARHHDGDAASVPNLPRELNPVLGAITGYHMERDRLNWITYRLLSTDPDNLFFRYLYLRSMNALTVPAKIRLMESLLSMPQFPSQRLPTSCDRRADYLWQRDSREYYEKSRFPYCDQYNGVDFLWMVANLVADDHPDIAAAGR